MKGHEARGNGPNSLSCPAGTQRIFLIRHGESEGNKDETLYCRRARTRPLFRLRICCVQVKDLFQIDLEIDTKTCLSTPLRSARACRVPDPLIPLTPKGLEQARPRLRVVLHSCYKLYSVRLRLASGLLLPGRLLAAPFPPQYHQHGQHDCFCCQR